MLNLNNEHPDDVLLEDARMAASSDWEETFVADMLEKRRKFGLNFRLTDGQREKLEEIAGNND